MPALNTTRTAKHAVIRARIDETTKARATETLSQLGLTPSDVIRLLMTHIAEEGSIPFDIHVPNSTTKAALEESEESADVPGTDNVDGFLDLLENDV